MSEKKKSLSDIAYEKIKENILNLTYLPGEILTETALSKQLDMSRSPVRTAIKTLQAEGLIITDYYKSLKVREITEKDIKELYQIRELFETDALKLIFSTDRYEEYSYRLEEKIVRMCAVENDIYKWEVADLQMHMEIISIFENERIKKIYENNMSELITMGLASIRNGFEIKNTNIRLKQMVTYMRNNDYEKTYEILKEDHFNLGKSTATKL